MSQESSSDSGSPGQRAGSNRREVLLGATGLAVAAAGATMFGTGAAQAAPATGPLTGEIDGLGSFEVLAFSWGASNSGSLHVGGGGGAGKANFQDVSLTKYIDEHSPALVGAVATGRHFKGAAVVFVAKKGGPAVRLEMKEVLVTSVSLGGSAGESRLTENVTLNFAEFKYSYDEASTSWRIAGTKE